MLVCVCIFIIVNIKIPMSGSDVGTYALGIGYIALVGKHIHVFDEHNVLRTAMIRYALCTPSRVIQISIGRVFGATKFRYTQAESTTIKLRLSTVATIFSM